jgi:hypothetical protein
MGQVQNILVVHLKAYVISIKEDHMSNFVQNVLLTTRTGTRKMRWKIPLLTSSKLMSGL